MKKNPQLSQISEEHRLFSVCSQVSPPFRFIFLILSFPVSALRAAADNLKQAAPQLVVKAANKPFSLTLDKDAIWLALIERAAVPEKQFICTVCFAHVLGIPRGIDTISVFFLFLFFQVSFGMKINIKQGHKKLLRANRLFIALLR